MNNEVIVMTALAGALLSGCAATTQGAGGGTKTELVRVLPVIDTGTGTKRRIAPAQHEYYLKVADNGETNSIVDVCMKVKGITGRRIPATSCNGSIQVNQTVNNGNYANLIAASVVRQVQAGTLEITKDTLLLDVTDDLSPEDRAVLINRR